jgi:hypothetical protein
MLENSSCTLCGLEGRILVVADKQSKWCTCLCILHDSLCFLALMEQDFILLAVSMKIASGRGGEQLTSEDLAGAELLAILRMTGLGLSAEDIEAYKVLMEEIPDEEDELDIELRLLNFLKERNLLGVSDE